MSLVLMAEKTTLVSLHYHYRFRKSPYYGAFFMLNICYWSLSEWNERGNPHVHAYQLIRDCFVGLRPSRKDYKQRISEVDSKP